MRKTYGVIAFAAVLAMSMMFSDTGFAYEEAKVENGGALKGKITYTGTVPTRKVVPTKDMDICGGVREDPLIKVGPGNGVKEVVVYIKDVEAGKAFDRPETPAVIDNRDCRFHPHVQVARKGPVEVHNSDDTLHNTHGFYGKKTAFNVALPIKGMKVRQRLKQAGEVRVECDSHGWMRGWMYVVENPYYDITAEDGTFAIEGVPPGEHTVLIWQEGAGIMEKTVTVKPGETVNLEVELKK
ncbi:MAG: carboxypeptidase regulatory-like domain-containing protein [Nitrospirota bacterium]|jgi:hypothetical protein